MEVGKVSGSSLKRVILKNISSTRNEVTQGPSVAYNFSALKLDKEEEVFVTSKTLIGDYKNIENIAVSSVANRIGTSGGQVIGIMVNIILPSATYESKLEKIIKGIESACRSLNIDILGVDAQVTDFNSMPVIAITGLGKSSKDKVIKPSTILANQEIVMTKWIAGEATTIIANERESELQTRFTDEFINRAKGLIRDVSSLKEAKIASEMNVSSMYEIGQGGIFGSLWEIGEELSVGLEVDISKIPIKQETIEICEFYDLNPYKLTSTGCLLIITDQGASLTAKLNDNNIDAALIGRTTKGNERIVKNGDYRRFLAPPKGDELKKIKELLLPRKENGYEKEDSSSN